MIRPANENDLSEIVAIERASFDDPWTEEDFTSFMNNRAVRFLVWCDGGVGGYVIYSLICGEAEIFNIAVTPGRRRSGIGRALLDAAVGEADSAFLDVRRSNLPAIGLYSGRGFVQIGIRKKYYDNGEDALVMKWGK